MAKNTHLPYLTKDKKDHTNNLAEIEKSRLGMELSW